MAVSILDFWKLVVASGLLAPERCKALHAQFLKTQAEGQSPSLRGLAQWLVDQDVLTRYQVTQLAAGKSGPFKFGPYTVRKWTDSGRFAERYQAGKADGTRALLVFAPQLGYEPADYDDFCARSAAATRVVSPHVSRVLELVESDPPAAAVETLKGHTLRELLSARKPSVATACRIGFQLSLGLVALHGQGRVHGSICPENIWVDPTGTIKLLQFPLVPGASRARRDELPLVDYLAPELWNPRQAPNELSDIYALGCTLHELISGGIPFTEGTLSKKRQQHETAVPARLDRLVQGVPEELADLIAEMLDKEPMLRCQSANQAAALLGRYATGAQGRGATPPRVDFQGPAMGYGAWQAGDWAPPPQQRAMPAAPPQAAEHSAAGAAPPIESPGDAAPPAKPTIPQAAPVAPRAAAPIEPEPEPTAAASWSLDALSTPTSAMGVAAGPVIVTSPATTAVRATPQRSGSNGLRLAAIGALLILAIAGVGVWFLSQGESESSSTASPAAADASSAAAAAAQAANQVEQAESPEPLEPASNEIADNGQTLWASPTKGQPLALNFLPSGAQVLLVLRPAELLASAEGQRLADSLGPDGQSALQQLRSIVGVDLAEIEQLAVAFVPNDSGLPQAALVARLAGTPLAESLLAGWGNPQAAEFEGHKYWRGAQYAYWLPEAESGRVAVVAPLALMQEVISAQGPPLVRKGLERLLAHSDQQRLLTLCFAPSYLLTDGKSLLVGDWQRLHDPLARFLDESIEGLLLSAHLSAEGSGQSLYLELRAVAPVDKRPQELVTQLRDRVHQLPQQVETYLATLTPQPYGRLVVNRLPRMLQLLDDYARAGIDDHQAVLNAYLPGAAAHNLVLAAQLALWEQPSGGGQAAVAARPATVADALRRTISLSFPREALDRCMEQLAAELGVPIEIQGSDLQLEGITKNQSLNNLDERNQPAAAVLQKVLKMANPAGKLIYVVHTDQAGGESLWITTRVAAAKRGDQLPAEFEKSAGDSP